MKRLLVCAGMAMAGSMIWAQGTAPTPAFDISDVHSSARATRPGSRGGVLRGDRWEIRNASMVDLIQLAYGVEAEKILGGPRWLEMAHYDIAATAPRGTPPDTVKLMVKTLLTERFQLAVHEDKREVPGFALVPGKGAHKMKKGDAAEPDCKGKPTPPEAVGLQGVSCHNLTADMLVGFLRDAGGTGYFNGPLVNATGLEGSWDFDFQWTERNRLAQAGIDAIPLFDAVEKQLGLKIEQRSVPSPVLVVDRVNEKPTDNAPGVAEKLAPAKARDFEVATIKPNPAPVGAINVGIQGDGRLEARAVSLRQLIAIAWDIPANRISEGPAALDAHGFDVVAKAALDPVNGLDIEEFRLMMRSMLIERFEMKLQMQDREMPAYTLVAGKPKMAKADPANRASCKEGPAPASTQDARNKVLARNRLVTCRNVTMKEFADQLDQLVSGYVKAPVLDATKLEGTWDFSLNFSGVNVLNAALAAQGPGGGLAADPNGAISLEDAVKEQLGLKLEMGKRASPVLVVEKALENPTEN